MSTKRKLSDTFPQYSVVRLVDRFPASSVPPLKNFFRPLNTKGGFGGAGFLNPSTITRVAPVFTPPIPSFSIDYRDHLDNSYVAVSSTISPGTILVSFGTSMTLTNTTDDLTYSSLEWTVKNVTTDTFLPVGNAQVYVIPDSALGLVTYEVTLRAFWNGTQGVAFATLLEYEKPTPSITFNGVSTTYRALPPPEVYISPTNETTLTFTNSTIPLPAWDNVVLTCTVT